MQDENVRLRRLMIMIFSSIWILVTFLPMLGFDYSTPSWIGSSIAYAGLTIGLAILLKK